MGGFYRVGAAPKGQTHPLPFFRVGFVMLNPPYNFFLSNKQFEKDSGITITFVSKAY